MSWPLESPCEPSTSRPALSSALAGSPALSAPCRDAKGKFVKCPEKSAPAPKRCKDAKGKFVKCPEKKAQPTRCKDSRGKFVKCGTPGAKPV